MIDKIFYTNIIIVFIIFCVIIVFDIERHTVNYYLGEIIALYILTVIVSIPVFIIFKIWTN